MWYGHKHNAMFCAPTRSSTCMARRYTVNIYACTLRTVSTMDCTYAWLVRVEIFFLLQRCVRNPYVPVTGGGRPRTQLYYMYKYEDVHRRCVSDAGLKTKTEQHRHRSHVAKSNLATIGNCLAHQKRHSARMMIWSHAHLLRLPG